MAQRRLNRLLRPRSIVFVGGRHVASAIRTTRRASFDGDIAVVNPTREDIAGVRCTPSIADLPFIPDAALVALSPERSIVAVGELAALGVGGSVVISSGFREIGAYGADLEIRLAEAAGDMALIGPNCLGVINQFDGAAVFGDDVLARQVAVPGAAIVSQSGAFMIGIACVERAFPLGYAISIGNQAQIGHAECIEALLDDPRVKAIGLYLEGLDDGAALGRACWRAAKAGVPIVALKGGDGALGSQVAQSHTAAILVESAVWRAFVDRFGIREVSSLKALVETLKILSVGGVSRGRRATIVSFSGGLNGQVARAAATWGIELPPPLPDRAEALTARLPRTIAVSNPLDLNLPYTSNTGASLEDEEAIADIIVDLAEGVADQVAFILDVPPSGPDRLDEPWLPAIRAMTQVRDRLGVPAIVAGILPEGLEPALRERILADGLVPLGGFAEAIEAMGHAAALAIADHGAGPCPELLPPLPDAPVRTLDEQAAKAMFAAAGIAVPRHIAATPEEAPIAARSFDVPVAIKALSGAILHKAAIGGVSLSLGPNEVVRAVTRMQSALADHGHDLAQILIEEMVPDPRREIILGARHDPAMGIVMVVGAGGAGVEAHRGTVHTLLLPLQEATLEHALADLGLTEHAAMRAAATAFAAFAVAHSETLETAEINPLILTASGAAIAADAVIQLRDIEGDPR